MIPDIAFWMLAIAAAIIALPILLELLIWLVFGVAFGTLWFIDKVTP
jgi:hypothetical protein